MADSLDLVPIGGYYGRGKRTGMYGGYVMACYDPYNEEYQMVCKLGTGFSDKLLKELTELLEVKKLDAPLKYYSVSDVAVPDVWFEPVAVWEVQTADLSLSPHYTAGIGKVVKDKGISLRFPRFIRVRTDKTPEQATTSDQIAALYRNQKSLKK